MLGLSAPEELNISIHTKTRYCGGLLCPQYTCFPPCRRVRFPEFSPEQVTSFQRNILKTILQLETTFFELAEQDKKNVLIVCDRGAMDPSACNFKLLWFEPANSSREECYRCFVLFHGRLLCQGLGYLFRNLGLLCPWGAVPLWVALPLGCCATQSGRSPQGHGNSKRLSTPRAGQPKGRGRVTQSGPALGLPCPWAAVLLGCPALGLGCRCYAECPALGLL